MTTFQEIRTKTLREHERWVIVQALEAHGGNKTHAARALGICVRTIRNKIQKHALKEWKGSGPFPKQGEVK